jgi:hypothetical protein
MTARARFSINQGAAYLDVSPSTLSRHLAPERATRGRDAALSVDELLAAAEALGQDVECVRRRITGALGLDPDLPADIREWAIRAVVEDKLFDLDGYNARVPPDVLERPPEGVDDFAPRAPWDASVPLLSGDELLALLDGDG